MQSAFLHVIFKVLNISIFDSVISKYIQQAIISCDRTTKRTSNNRKQQLVTSLKSVFAIPDEI